MTCSRCKVRPRQVGHYCRVCQAERLREWRAANRQRAREIQRRTDARIERRTRKRDRRRSSPEKDAARHAVARALLNGELVRPETCERCGQDPGRAIGGRAMIEGHHVDYSRPLDVEWLCARCHADEHPLKVAA